MSSRKQAREQLRQDQRQHEEQQKREERDAALWGTPVIAIGITLLMWQVNIFHVTIVPVKIPLLILFVCTVIAIPFFKKWFAKRLLATNNFYVLFYCMLTSGSFFSTAFTATNYYFADGAKFNETVNIVAKGYRHQSKSKCDVPYVSIDFKEISKEVDFNCSTPIKDYKYVDLTLQTGFWGYDVIVDKHLHN